MSVKIIGEGTAIRPDAAYLGDWLDSWLRAVVGTRSDVNVDVVGHVHHFGVHLDCRAGTRNWLVSRGGCGVAVLL